MKCSLDSDQEGELQMLYSLLGSCRRSTVGKKKELWMAFLDLEKAFDRVPREVVWWALRQMDVDGWLINAVKSMYKNAKTSVKVNGVGGRDFPVEVGVHQGSVLSPLLFIIVMEALSKRFDKQRIALGVVICR